MRQASNRWFVLALAFLLLNAYAVLRPQPARTPAPLPLPVPERPAERPALLALTPLEVHGREPLHFQFSLPMEGARASTSPQSATGEPGSAASAGSGSSDTQELVLAPGGPLPATSIGSGPATAATPAATPPFQPAPDTAQPPTPALAAFSPPIAGTFRWESPNHLVFFPAADWRNETPYEVTLSPALRASTGAPLAAPLTSRIDGEPLRLVSLRQTAFSDDREIGFTLSFNHAIDAESVEKQLALANADGAPVLLDRQDAGSRAAVARTRRTGACDVEFRTVPVSGDRLLVVLKAGLTGVDGPAPLAAPPPTAMRAELAKLPQGRKPWRGEPGAATDAPPSPLADAAELHVLDLSFELKLRGLEAETQGPELGEIRAEFPAPILAKQARPFLEIEPSVAWTAEEWHGGLQLSGGFRAGTRYTLTFKKGLPARKGAVLAADVRRSVLFDDVRSYVRLGAEGTYLSAASSLLLSVESVNCPRFLLTIRRVFPSNLVHYARGRRSWYSEASDLSATLVPERRVTVAETEKNRQARTLLDLGKLLGAEAHGALLVSVRPDGGYGRDARLVVVSDLGLVVKHSAEELVAWVNSIRSASPVAGAKVTAWSRASQVLATGTTDAEGLAKLAAGNCGSGGGGSGTSATEADAEPFVVTVESGEDLSFVELGRTELPTSGLDVGGRSYVEKGYEACVYTDRGICRPGETLRLKGVVRDRAAAAPSAAFPVEWVVERPDGRPFLRRTLPLSAAGTSELELPLGEAVPTGRWSATLGLPGSNAPFGAASFQVEDYAPPQIEVAVALPEGRLAVGAETPVTLRARHLFGAPAAGLAVENSVTFAPARFAPAGWAGYEFRDATREGAQGTVTLNLGKSTLDENGEATFILPARKGAQPASALTVTVQATVLDVTGRTVTARATRPLDATTRYVGLQVPGGGAVLPPGRPCAVRIALVSPDGKPESGKVHARLSRLDWHTTLVTGSDGRHRYESAVEAVLVSESDIEVLDGRAEHEVRPAAPGTYQLVVVEPASSASASANLEVWSGADEGGSLSMEKPGRVELSLDRESYAPGDMAEVRVKAPFAGRALLTVESDHVHYARVVTLDGRTARLSVPITTDLWPNAYCGLHLIRPTGPETPWLPHRAYGAVPLRLETGGRRLAVKLEAPGEVRPGTRLSVAVAVSEAKGLPAAGAELTLAAVDEGICALTGFATPDPLSFFAGKRGLGVRAHDLYTLLLPELERPAEGAQPASGGDDGEERRPGSAALDPRMLSPVRAARFRPVALWQGRVVAGADGCATIAFDVPEFTGRFRLMAVVVAPKQFGSAEAAVLVRRPLVVKLGLPRFLAPGDEFEAPVHVFNRTAAAGTPAVTVRLEGPLVLAGAELAMSELAAGAEGRTTLRLRAGDAPGVARVTLAVALGAERSEETVELAVRPPIGLVKSGGIGTIDGAGKVVLPLSGDYLSGTRRAEVTVSALPAAQWEAAIRDLLHYPYGCVEQTTSSSFPLLYLGDLAAGSTPERLAASEVEARVQAGIDRLLSMQTSSGGFGYWPGDDSACRFGSVYATHFLGEALKAGYACPPEALEAAYGYLDRLLDRTVRVSGEDLSEFRESFSEKAYALLVLAEAGRVRVAWQNRLLEGKADLCPTARCHLAASLRASGRDAEAESLLALPPAGETAARESGRTFHSGVREDAVFLSVALDAKRAPAVVRPLVARLLAAMKNGRWGTTQENAFAAMALGKYFRAYPPRAGDVRGRLVTSTGDGRADGFSRERPLHVTLPEGADEVTIESEGDGLLFYAWQSDGVPAHGRTEERDQRLRVRRTLLDAEGKPLTTKRVRRGELVRVRLTIAADRDIENLAISDLLPAGLEIENPRLLTSRQMAEAGDKLRRLDPDRVEMRDDRLLLFGAAGPQEASYDYLARAVTIGRFVLPPVSAECMYDPEATSVHGGGWVEVGE
ncbi:MAG: alpha-2-macroglobulin family protein [Planctomycetes bacterium]|nr:alpha-2-macroglobulin family protein [Planctomycetota bacterium]